MNKLADIADAWNVTATDISQVSSASVRGDQNASRAGHCCVSLKLFVQIIIFRYLVYNRLTGNGVLTV